MSQRAPGATKFRELELSRAVGGRVVRKASAERCAVTGNRFGLDLESLMLFDGFRST
jgi:hypothetical protein